MHYIPRTRATTSRISVRPRSFIAGKKHWKKEVDRHAFKKRTDAENAKTQGFFAHTQDETIPMQISLGQQLGEKKKEKSLPSKKLS